MGNRFNCQDDILCGVNKPKDINNLTDLEKKHMPVIEAPEKTEKEKVFEVFVQAGKLLAHPNEPAHFIEWIELYCGDTFVGEASFCGGMSYPNAIFKITLAHAEGPLRARVKCNLHGLWETEKSINIL